MVLHWLAQRQNKLLFQTLLRVRLKYTTHTTSILFLDVNYLRDLSAVNPSRSTRSSTPMTQLQIQIHSSLQITNLSSRHAAPHLWNKLRSVLRVPYQFGASSSPSSSPSSGSGPGPIVDISYGVFQSGLKTLLFSKSVFPYPSMFAQAHLMTFDHSVFVSHWRR